MIQAEGIALHSFRRGLFIIGDNLTLRVGQLVRAAAKQITFVGWPIRLEKSKTPVNVQRNESRSANSTGLIHRL